MPTSSSHDRGRGRSQRPRPRGAALRLGLVGLVGVLALGGAWAAQAASSSRPGAGATAARPTLSQAWQARSGGQQVLGGTLHAGVPTVQRLVHDQVPFTVAIGPAQPGRNVVRVDTGHESHGAGAAAPPVYVGTSGADLVLARPRPGVDGLWATVDLPAGQGAVLVTHGPVHRIPFPVETGRARTASPAWNGPDAPECLSAALGTSLAGGRPDARGCPTDSLTRQDSAALQQVVGTLADRGVTQLALDVDTTTRSRRARDLVTRVARGRGLTVAAPQARPGPRSALLDLGGWDTAGRHLAAVSRLPLRQQPIRSDGTWLAPWLLSRGVVDSTAGAVLPLSFDIRDRDAGRYAQVLATYLPGQAPTASGYAAWRDQRGDDPGSVRLYAASRAAYMPAQPGHEAHETQVSWFPGGTITPVGPVGTTTSSRAPLGP